MSYEQLQELLYPLLAQRDAEVENSDGHKAILDLLGQLCEEHENATTVIEDYNSQPSE